jgi:Zn-dependent protease
MPDLAEALTYYVVFLFSTTVHEAAHAWAAKLGGDLTAYHGGQVSLDPMPHIRREPFGMVVLPLLTAFTTGWPFGYASAPYDPDWAQRHPKRAAWMALAGPVSNLVLVLIAAAVIKILISTGMFTVPSSVSFGRIAIGADGTWAAGAAYLLGVFFSLNLLLFVFNLLPLPPLDGSGVIPLGLSDETARVYQRLVVWNPAFSIIGMLVAWQVFPSVFRPVFSSAIGLLYPGLFR